MYLLLLCSTAAAVTAEAAGVNVAVEAIHVYRLRFDSYDFTSHSLNQEQLALIYYEFDRTAEELTADEKASVLSELIAALVADLLR